MERSALAASLAEAVVDLELAERELAQQRVRIADLQKAGHSIVHAHRVLLVLEKTRDLHAERCHWLRGQLAAVE